MKTPASRKPFNFPDSIKHRVNAYAIAAGAAASLLTTAQVANAEVVFTPIDTTFRNGQLPLDVDRDGIVDFVLIDKEVRRSLIWESRVFSVEPRSSGDTQNAVVGSSSIFYRSPQGRPLQVGGVISSNRQFVTGHVRLASIWETSGGPYSGGYFRNQSNVFLGFKFQISGETHYGWVSFKKVLSGFTHNHNLSITALINGMAYETVPNQPITAGDKGPSTAVTSPSPEMTEPQPSSLGVLALGAPGLSIWRRE